MIASLRWCVCVFALPLTGAVVADDGKHLFILSGQSNMVRLDPELTFKPALEHALGKRQAIIVKDAQNGASIRYWVNDWETSSGKSAGKRAGMYYSQLIEKVSVAIEGQNLASVTFVWMQGESDARRDADVYERSLHQLIAQLEADLGRTDINVVLGRISDHDNPKKFPHWQEIRSTQMKIAESSPRMVWVNTDDLNDGKDRRGRELVNDLHYTPKGYQILGSRFAEAAVLLVLKGSPDL